MGDVALASLTVAIPMFVTVIPKVVGFAVILIISWFIAGLVEKGFASLLRMVKLKNLAARSGFGNFLSRMDVKIETVGFVGLILLVGSFSAVGLPVISDVVRELLFELPNWAVALVVLAIGGLAAGALSSLVHGAASSADSSHPALYAKITNVVVRVFAIAAAINQIEIVTILADALIMATVGAVTLAFGLTFKSSGREIGRSWYAIGRSWYAKGKQAIPGMTEAAQDVHEQARQQDGQRMHPSG